MSGSLSQCPGLGLAQLHLPPFFLVSMPCLLKYVNRFLLVPEKPFCVCFPQGKLPETFFFQEDRMRTLPYSFPHFQRHRQQHPLSYQLSHLQSRVLLESIVSLCFSHEYSTNFTDRRQLAENAITRNEVQVVHGMSHSWVACSLPLGAQTSSSPAVLTTLISALLSEWHICITHCIISSLKTALFSMSK